MILVTHIHTHSLRRTHWHSQQNKIKRNWFDGVCACIPTKTEFMLLEMLYVCCCCCCMPYLLHTDSGFYSIFNFIIFFVHVFLYLFPYCVISNVVLQSWMHWQGYYIGFDTHTFRFASLCVVFFLFFFSFRSSLFCYINFSWIFFFCCNFVLFDFFFFNFWFSFCFVLFTDTTVHCSSQRINKIFGEWLTRMHLFDAIESPEKPVSCFCEHTKLKYSLTHEVAVNGRHTEKILNGKLCNPRKLRILHFFLLFRRLILFDFCFWLFLFVTFGTLYALVRKSHGQLGDVQRIILRTNRMLGCFGIRGQGNCSHINIRRFRIRDSHRTKLFSIFFYFFSEKVS